MKTYRFLIDDNQTVWHENDAVKIIFNGVRTGKPRIGIIKTIGVNMMTMKFYDEMTKTFSEEQLMDIHTIIKIEKIYPIWLKENQND